MKKTILFLICLSVMFHQAYAFSFLDVAPSGQTLYYNIVNGNAEVTYAIRSSSGSSYPSLSGSLTIPATVTYNGTTYSVTSIGDQAFVRCSGLTSVTIPNSVTSISAGAFFYCSGLTSVTIPNSVTSIGQQAFSGCSGLTSVTIPNSVTSIGQQAFSGCSGLTSVTIPNSVTSIGQYAFSVCSGLTSVTIGSSVTSIGDAAFAFCNGLTSIVVTSGNSVYDSRNNCNAIIHTSTNTLIAGCRNTIIPNSVTSIGERAFYGCSGLTSVTIGNSVTNIGKRAFYGCSGLSSVTIPNSVTSIGDWAFYGCSGLATVIFNATNCTTYSDSNTIIGEIPQDNFFGNCNNLITITIGNSVTHIPNCLFKNCSSLTTLNFNADSCASAGNSSNNRAFLSCNSISVVNFGNNVKVIPPYLLYSCSSLISITIPNSVISIGEGAFTGCRGATGTLTIPNSVTSIGPWAFQNCSGFTSVTIPNSVTSIENYVFCGCRGLRTLTIPNSVTSIGINAFSGCSSLTSVTIPNSVTSIGNDAFRYDSSIVSIMVASGNNNYDSRNNCNAIIHTQSNELIVGCNNTVIPNSVTTIRGYAFTGCSGLTSVTIPNSVTSIGECAFLGCRGLTSATIGNSVTSIENRTFYGCSGLTSVTIGSSVTSIGLGAFSGCNGLTEINSLNIVAPQLSIDSYSSNHPFSDVSSTIPVHIPCGGLTSYSSRWSYFSNFIEASGHSFDAVTADSTMGNVTILTQPTCQAPTAVFNAVPSSGYRFSNWSDGSTTNPRSLVVTQDTVIMAYFEASSDTIFIHDTIYIYDTIYIHDTIYVGGNAIGDVMTIDAKIYQRDGQIVVEGAEGMPVMLYDATGRLLATQRREEMHGGTPVQFNVPASGTYLIKVGNYPARKVVVIR